MDNSIICNNNINNSNSNNNNNNNNNNSNNNNKTIKLPNIIIIKIINYLTSFYESSSFLDDVNQLFLMVFSCIVRDLLMISKEWHNVVSKGIKLPSFYLLSEYLLEGNESLKKIALANPSFVKIGMATRIYNNKVFEKYYKSISTLCLQPNQHSTITETNIIPYKCTNITTLELILSNCGSNSIPYLRRLFPIEMFYSENIKDYEKKNVLDYFKKINLNTDEKTLISNQNKYDYEWTRRIERLIISKIIENNETDILDFSIFNDFINLGGFESLFQLKIISNNIEINGYESLLFQKITHLSLYGIRININKFDKLLSLKNNNLKHLEITQCTTDKEKSYGFNSILAKYTSKGTCNLETYYHDTFETQDINSLIDFFSSSPSNNGKLNTLRIRSRIDLSTVDYNIQDLSSSNNSTSIKFISLYLPDPSFIKFIFSKISFNLSSLNLKFIKPTISNEINENGFDYEMVEILLDIIKNQSHCLNTIRVQVEERELNKIRKGTSYPPNCNMKKIFKYITDEPNQIQEIDFKNIWISKSTIIDSLLSFNSNPKSLIRYFSVVGLSDIKINDFLNNLDTLFIKDCKLLTLGLSLLPLNLELPKPTSYYNRFTPSLLKSTPLTYIDLLIEILEKSKTLQHIMVDEYDELLFSIPKSTLKKLEDSILLNKTIISIGVPSYLSSYVPSSKPIFTFFNPITR